MTTLWIDHRMDDGEPVYSVRYGIGEAADDFFGTESPESYITDEQRRACIRFWLEEGWLAHDDEVSWDGTVYKCADMLGGDE